ncbi:DUF1806 family protein [Alicyclobacillus acidiphilus]|uniref:DUF1806 family protein n=1 Tax=Alicyclobacillus acidiphilus TaxID=182455 RepID=UPI0008342BBF|nr:DUF1806 family protein [Alicyclobacillus acidiphilus]
MQTLSLDEAKNVLQSYVNRPVYIHLEVNPEAYLRNALVTYTKCEFFGEDSYRVHFLLTNPEGMLSIKDVTDAYDDGGVIVLCGYDDQSRIAQTLSVSPQPLQV